MTTKQHVLSRPVDGAPIRAAVLATIAIIASLGLGKDLAAITAVFLACGHGLAVAAQFITQAAVVLASLSLVGLVAGRLAMSFAKPAPAGNVQLEALPAETIEQLEARDMLARGRATLADWSLMVHLSSWLWLLIGVVMLRGLAFLGIVA